MAVGGGSKIGARLARVRGETYIALAAAVAALLVGGLAVLLLWLEREATLSAGARRAADYARLVDEQTARTFHTIDFALRAAIDAIERSPAMPEHDAQLEQDLRDMLPLMPGVRALYVVGADGFITQDTDHPRTPRVSLADRDYFRAHRDNPDIGLHIGAPLRSRSTGNWFVSVSRRLTRPDGGFGGVAAAALEPFYDEALYGELQLGPKDALALFHRDGTLILRVPEQEGMTGENLSDLDLFARELKVRPRGTFWAAGRLGGDGARLVSYREISGLPLVAAVALDRDAMLAGWRRTAITMLGLYLVFAAAVWGLAEALSRRWRERREARRRALATQKLQSLGQLAGSMAHDFSNVLAAVRASLHMIERHVQDPAKIGLFARAADQAVEHGASLVSQLRAFARGHALEVRRLDAVELLRRMEPTLRQAAGPKVRIRLKTPGKPIYCSLDQTQFDAALLNLVANARDAMPKGGEVRIRAESLGCAHDDGPDAKLRLVVEDDGEGIADEVRRRMFDPFFTTKGDAGGTGLGLAQVYGFVQQSGGEISVRSAPGEGAAFELLLPCADLAGGAAGGGGAEQARAEG